MTPTNLYLTLMRKRFNMLNDPEVDPVPWELDDKDTAYAYVERAGYRVPRYVRTSSPAEALEAGIAMGDRFVIKQPNRHSTMGIYILEKLSNGKFLELFSLKELEAKDVVAVGPEPDYWLTEECIESQVAGRPLPFDYKVYAFRGKISHVVQIDRNVYPPRIAVFDGAFIPMKPEVDYWTDPDRWLHENHVMPVHAGAILEMASTLSKGLDTRFVRVDCFDGPDGPVFGEFTFASGPDDVGMLIYKSEIFEALDAAIDGADIPAFSGFDIDLDRFYSDLTKESTFEGPERGPFPASQRWSPRGFPLCSLDGPIPPEREAKAHLRARTQLDRTPQRRRESRIRHPGRVACQGRTCLCSIEARRVL